MAFALRSIVLLALLFGLPAQAQKVVILEIDGDQGNKLRAQIEAAVKRAGVVDTLSLQSYKDAAARRRLRGAAAFTPAGVARTAKRLRFDAAVAGEIASGTYKVLIWDRLGSQLWTKDLPLKRGLLSEDLVSKLARAIAAAAAQGAAQPSANAAVEEGGPDEGAIDLTPSAEPRTPVEHREDPDRDADLDNKPAAQVAVPGPPILRGWLAGMTIWRSQCLRPGVKSCREYDVAAIKPPGIVIDFSSRATDNFVPPPYWGFLVNAELFPLGGFRSKPIHRFFNGVGLLASVSFGQSVTRIVEATAQGQGEPKKVNSVDLGYSFQLAYRVHLAMGYGTPQPAAFVGLRAGLLSRNFNIDPSAGSSLPSSQRTYPTGFGFPVVGLDVSVPIAPFLRFDLGGSLFINPRTSAEQIIGYGNLQDPTGGAQATGGSFDAGASGELIGPLGWILRFRYTAFADRYSGQGQKWTTPCTESQACGGAGEETFTQILWGLTGSF